MRFVKDIVQSSLFKISSLNSFSMFLKIGIGLITSKVLAVFIGPSGMALVGNFRNFVTSFETLSTLGFQNGIIKYIAENKEEELIFKKYISTIVITIITISILLSGVLFGFSKYWNDFVFGNASDYQYVFKTYAIALPFYGLSIALMAVVNGLGRFRNVIYSTIIGNILGLVVTIFFVTKLQTLGALIAIIVTPSLLFFVAFYFVSKEVNLFKTIKIRSFDFAIIQQLSHYFLMALVSGLVGSWTYFSVRNEIIQNIGLQQAGYWEAITRISTYYLLFVTTIIAVYFLPNLVIAKDYGASKKVVWQYYKTILPTVVFGLLLVYFFRFFIVRILFSTEFLPVAKLFFWQLVGDFLKCASLILGYQLYAKKLTIAFILTELFSLAVVYFSSVFFLELYGIEGVVMAHAFTYGVYLLVLGIYFRKIIF